MLNRLKRVADLIGTVAYAVLFLTFIFQVVLRFVFNQPLTWSDELIVILYVFSMFWAAAFLLKEKDHVMLDLVYERLPAGGKRAFCIVYSLAIGGLFLWALPETASYVKFMMRENTPVLGVPFAFVFAVFVVFLLSVGIQYLRKLVVLLGPNWRRELERNDSSGEAAQ